MHLDSEDDDATSAGDEVGQHQIVVFDEKTLHNEGGTSNSHGNKTWQRDAIGVACTDGLNSLRQIAEDKTERGNPTTNVN